MGPEAKEIICSWKSDQVKKIVNRWKIGNVCKKQISSKTPWCIQTRMYAKETYSNGIRSIHVCSKNQQFYSINSMEVLGIPGVCSQGPNKVLLYREVWKWRSEELPSLRKTNLPMDTDQWGGPKWSLLTSLLLLLWEWNEGISCRLSLLIPKLKKQISMLRNQLVNIHLSFVDNMKRV